MMRSTSRDDGATTLIALIAVVIVTAFSLISVTLAMREITPTVTEERATRNIAAAQWGTEAMLGRIRSAGVPSTSEAGEVVAVQENLPCAPLSGVTPESHRPTEFEVRVRYYTSDPQGQDEMWRNANALDCVSDPSSLYAARFALIEATGEPGGYSAGLNRRLETIYQFTREEPLAGGGKIHLHEWSGNRLAASSCLAAESLDASAPNRLVTAKCAEGASPTQDWVHTTTGALMLAATQGSTTPLCMAPQYPPRSTISAEVLIAPCTGGEEQRFWDNREQQIYVARRPSGAWRCLRPDVGLFSAVPYGTPFHLYGSSIINDHDCGPVDIGTIPAPGVGAKHVEAFADVIRFSGQRQLCLDHSVPAVGSAYPIVAYVCSHDKYGNQLANQTWRLGADGLIRTGSGLSERCLAAVYSSSGDSLELQTCNSTSTSQQWETFGADASEELRFAYRNVRTQTCLGLIDDNYFSSFEPVGLSACTGDSSQQGSASSTQRVEGKLTTVEVRGPAATPVS